MAEQGSVNPYRKDFPALYHPVHGKRLAYLDTGASAQSPKQVVEALSRSMTEHYANIHRGLYMNSQLTTALYEDARNKVAMFLNATTENEIVFTRNTTEGINLVAQSWVAENLSKGDEILISEMEHHANIVPWMMLCEKHGFVLKVIPVLENGALDMEAFEKLLSDKTRFFSITAVSNALGTRNPVREMISKVNKYSDRVKTLIDASQMVVHEQVDVQKLNCDFLVFTGHKLYGPNGIGVLYGREDLLNEMPPYQGGGDMIESVSFEKVTYKEAPARFEAGTPAIAEAIALAEAVHYVERVGFEWIKTQEQELLDELQTGLMEVPGIRIFGKTPGKAAIVSFVMSDIHPSDVATILDQCGVAVRTGHHCCEPLMNKFGLEGGTVRASIGLYNDSQDIMQFLEAVHKANKILG